MPACGDDGDDDGGPIALTAAINKEKTKTWRATLQKATHHTELL